MPRTGLTPSPATSIASAFDFAAAVQAPFRMQPGLRRLADGASQLHAVGRGSRHLAEKLLAWQRQPPTALLAIAGFDAAAALHALATQAATEHSSDIRWDGRCIHALQLGWAVDGDAVLPVAGPEPPLTEVGDALLRLPPSWRLPGLLALALAEDIAILDARDGSVPWLAVALPSHWAPEGKLGRHFTAVHAPVADNQLLLAASDALVRLVSAPTRWERFVWTITPCPTLDAHPTRGAALRWPDADADTVVASAWWRTERQTFIPVPEAQQAVFTILVDVQPLTQAIATAQQARQLHDALASMSEAVLRYRGLLQARAPLLQWLSRRAEAA